MSYPSRMLDLTDQYKATATNSFFFIQSDDFDHINSEMQHMGKYFW